MNECKPLPTSHHTSAPAAASAHPDASPTTFFKLPSTDFIPAAALCVFYGAKRVVLRHAVYGTGHGTLCYGTRCSLYATRPPPRTAATRI